MLMSAVLCHGRLLDLAPFCLALYACLQPLMSFSMHGVVRARGPSARGELQNRYGISTRFSVRCAE